MRVPQCARCRNWAWRAGRLRAAPSVHRPPEHRQGPPPKARPRAVHSLQIALATEAKAPGAHAPSAAREIRPTRPLPPRHDPLSPARRRLGPARPRQGPRRARLGRAAPATKK